MVEAMQAHPQSALGLCHSAPEDQHPYPWELSPQEAWKKQFFGCGCLSCGPSGAIIKRDAFVAVGGFRSWGVLSDTDLWYRMAARWPTLLLPPGLVWWRRHPDQEFRKDNAALTYLERGFALTVETLLSPECPLSKSDRQAALGRARQHHARRLLSLALRSRQPGQAWCRWRKSGLGATDLSRGFYRCE